MMLVVFSVPLLFHTLDQIIVTKLKKLKKQKLPLFNPALTSHWKISTVSELIQTADFFDIETALSAFIIV